MRIVSTLILSLVASLSLYGQIGVTSGFAKDTIQLGEEVSYTITLKVDPKITVLNVDLVALDSIISLVQTQIKAQTDTTGNPGPEVGDYTISSYGNWRDLSENKKIDITELSWDTTKLGNQLLLENTFKISFWDAGPHILRTPNVVYELGGITSEYASGTGAQIFVDAPFREQELSDSIDIAPIKPIIVEEKNITDFYPFFYAIGFLLMIPIVYFLYKKIIDKPVETEEKIEVLIPAHTIALEKLDMLRASKLWQKGEIKEYQTQLTYTIREYLENRYAIQALESSTDEITKALKESNFDPSDESDLKTILQVADLVKFAKAKPSEEMHEEFLNTAVSFVEKTQSMEATVVEVQPYLSNKTKINPVSPTSSSAIIPQAVNTKIEKGLIPAQYSYAGFWRRHFAHLIDINLFVILFVLIYLLAFEALQLDAGGLTPVKISLFTLCFFIAAVIYYAYPQHKFRQTIGKKLLSIEVVSHNKTNMSLLQSISRILIRLLSHVFILIPYVTFFFTKRKQTLHDLIVKSIVIKKEKKEDNQELLDVNIKV